MIRRRRVILPWVASAFALGVVGVCLYLEGRGAGKRAAGDGVVIDENIVYTTRPLRPHEMRERVRTGNVPFPAEARDFQFAEYGYWLSHESYLSFRAPPDVCVAYAQKLLDDHNRRNPADTASVLKPFDPSRETIYGPMSFQAPRIVSAEDMPVPWFRPDMIREGVEGGVGLRAPKVWVDTDRGIFYYKYFH